jgi:LysR family glycine cleavage system transcriptional activator
VRKLPPLNALRTFEAAARLTSFTEAASELCVTHGAVSQQIRALEDYFGRPLFTRSHGKVFLNNAGTELLPVITDSLDRIERISARLASDRNSEILTVSITTSFASHWLIPRLPDFQQNHPDIHVHLAPSPAFPANLGDGVDVAIRWGITTVDGIEMEKLIDVDTFAACSPSLISGGRPLRQPQDLLNHSLIHDDDGQAWQALLAEVGVVYPEQSRGLFYADSGLALQVAVEGGGVIVAGSILAANDLAAGRLVIPFDCIIPHRKAYNFYYPKQSADQRKISLFRDWIHQQATIFTHKPLDYSGYMV